MGAFRLLGLMSVVIFGGGWQGGMAAVELFLGMAGTTTHLLALATTMYTIHIHHVTIITPIQKSLYL
jgi:hypothetical protein